jgi:hypothetical protein
LFAGGPAQLPGRGRRAGGGSILSPTWVCLWPCFCRVGVGAPPPPPRFLFTVGLPSLSAASARAQAGWKAALCSRERPPITSSSRLSPSSPPRLGSSPPLSLPPMLLLALFCVAGHTRCCWLRVPLLRLPHSLGAGAGCRPCLGCRERPVSLAPCPPSTTEGSPSSCGSPPFPRGAPPCSQCMCPPAAVLYSQPMP